MDLTLRRLKAKPRQVKQGDNLVVSTQPTNLVDEVKVTNATNVTKTLLPLGNNAYSLTGFPVGPILLTQS
jgi:hypothetical protein